MKYGVKHRSALQSILAEWKLWLFIYIMTFMISTLISPSTVNETLTIHFLYWDLITSIPFALYVDLTYLIIVIVLTFFLALAIKVRITLTYQKDASILKEDILSTPGQLQYLLGNFTRDEIDLFEQVYNLNFWQCIYLKNYIRLIEAAISQSTRAPDSLLQIPVFDDPSEIINIEKMDPQFSEEEQEVFERIMAKTAEVSFWRRMLYMLSSKRIPVFHLLSKELDYKDYKIGNMKRLGDFIYSLTEPLPNGTQFLTIDEIKNLVRLANKQFDVELAISVEERDSEIWNISWDRGSIQMNGIKAGIEIPLFELSDLRGFEFSLNKIIDTMKGRHASNVLIISGYKMPRSANSSILIWKVLKSIEILKSKFRLSRTHRINLRTIFEKELSGTSINFIDVSNLYMHIEAFVNRQYTINEMLKLIDENPTRDSFISLLLRANLLPMSIELNGNSFTQVNSGRTLAASGLSGLPSITFDYIEKISDILGFNLSQMHSDKHCETKHLMDIPQYTRNLTVREYMPTFKMAEINSLGWIATGSGIWIGQETIAEYMNSSSRQNSTPHWLLFIDSPLTEKVFLEALTHQNYHYISEILTTKINLQSFQKSSKDDLFRLIWMREPFNPIGNYYHLNKESQEILRTITSISRTDQDIDSIISLLRVNQMIRNPVNTIGLFLGENSKCFSPISSMIYDTLLRQQMLEIISTNFSLQQGFIKNGQPTEFCFRINWLRSLRPGESPTDPPNFSDHTYTNPTTWNQPGFLDIITREAKTAYSLFKILLLYIQYYTEGNDLPFKTVQKIPHSQIKQNIAHLKGSYDLLCDFLSGEGCFARDGIFAIGQDKGYITWISKVLNRLPSIGEAMCVSGVFHECIKTCQYWYKLLAELLEKHDDPLASMIYDLICL